MNDGNETFILWIYILFVLEFYSGVVLDGSKTDHHSFFDIY